MTRASSPKWYEMPESGPGMTTCQYVRPLFLTKHPYHSLGVGLWQIVAVSA